jgi:hypothetical protein
MMPAKEGEEEMMVATNPIDNLEDYLDTCDILERINWLESDEHELEEDEAEELENLKKLIEEVRQYSGDAPEHGALLIRDSYFTEYAQELAEDIGAIGRDLQWPLMYIDWDAAADALKMAYSPVDFDGVEYWVRS